MSPLLTRLIRRRPRADHLVFTVYTRQQCCCCHKAIALLSEYQKRHRFRIVEQDIDEDPALKAQYDTQVPVVAVGNKVRFRGIVNRALLERLLLAETRSR